MKIKPLDDRVVLQRLEAEQKSAGGIIIPDSAKEKPQRGKVVAAGPGKRKKDGSRSGMEVKEGDLVLFGKYAGTEVKQGGEEYIILREDDILAVL